MEVPIKKRSPAAVLLLPFVTLGIYCIYWLYATRKELVSRSGDRYSIPPVILLFAPLLFLIALLVIAMILLVGSAVSDNTQHAFGTFLVLCSILGIIGLIALPLWWFWHYCKVLHETTKSMDFAQLYVLFVAITWVCNLFPVWMLIAQLELNKLADSEAAHHAKSYAHTHEPVAPA